MFSVVIDCDLNCRSRRYAAAMTTTNTPPPPPTIAIAGVGGAACTLVLKHQIATPKTSPPLQHLTVDTDPTCISGIDTMPTLLLRADTLDVEAFKPWLAPCQTLYLLAGLGGRISSVAAPALVRIARDMGLHTVALVTMPFDWEGSRRIDRAEQALRTIYVQAHEMVLVNSERVVQHLGDDCTLQDLFDCLDAAVLRELDARLVPMPTHPDTAPPIAEVVESFGNDTSASHRQFIASVWIKSFPRSWLKRQIPDDEPMHVPGYFDRLHYARETLRANMQPGDELWEFSSPTQTFVQRMCSRAGLLVLRQDKVVDVYLTTIG